MPDGLHVTMLLLTAVPCTLSAGSAAEHFGIDEVRGLVVAARGQTVEL